MNEPGLHRKLHIKICMYRGCIVDLHDALEQLVLDGLVRLDGLCERQLQM